MEHSQVPLSLLVTNLTAVTTFILRSLIFIMFDYRNGRCLRSCLLLPHIGERLLFWYVVTMWRKKNGPLNTDKKESLTSAC